MQAVLCIDFGSTYTKLTAIDLDQAEVIGTAQDYTTVETDVMEGFNKAFAKLQKATGDISYVKRLACSSAAGGLRMVACGLVPALTAKAARLAAFGAGAKVIKTYAYQLTRKDIMEIDDIHPDILLLTGGTDGGNQEVIEHNAAMLAKCQKAFPVVYAGNRASQDTCFEALHSELHPVSLTENVMPQLNKINIQSAQDIIRQVFLDKIIHAKGLSRQSDMIEGILMPTPAAVLSALTLLSKGNGTGHGIGEVVAADLGGATTDIYSIAKGDPVMPGTVLHGLREPYAKRTVEGDIGMRYSVHGIVEAAGMDTVCAVAGLEEEAVQAVLDRIDMDKSIIPQNETEAKLDFALAALAVRVGLCRHAGTLEMVYTPCGPAYQQMGKDLTEVSRIIVTGGAIIHSGRYEAIVQEAVKVEDEGILIPRHAKVMCDRRYILSALGLLSTYNKDVAFEILMKTFGKEDVHAIS